MSFAAAIFKPDWHHVFARDPDWLEFKSQCCVCSATVLCSATLCFQVGLILGKAVLSKTDGFLKKFQTAFKIVTEVNTVKEMKKAKKSA